MEKKLVMRLKRSKMKDKGGDKKCLGEKNIEESELSGKTY